MPDKDGILSAEEMQSARKWLEQRGVHNCPSCEHPNWIIAERLAFAHTYNPNGPIVIGAGYPAVMVVCRLCAYYRMHSAVIMGIVPSSMAAQDGGKHGT
jgi:hypothetical protein